MVKGAGYSDRLVRQEILKAHKHKKKDLLKDIKEKRNDCKFVFNLTYYPNFSNLKDSMLFRHLYLNQTRNTKRYFIRFKLLVSKKQKIWKIFW